MGVGDRIREARKQAGLTQNQLAEKSGVATISIHQYEAGKRKPQIERLQRIADALGVSITELIDIETASEYEKLVIEKGEEAQKKLSPLVQRAVDVMGELNREGQEKVVDYADDLAQSGKYIKTGQSNVGKKQA